MVSPVTHSLMTWKFQGAACSTLAKRDKSWTWSCWRRLSCVHMSAETLRQKKKQRVRERQRLIYRHKGFEICRNFFLHLHSIGEKKTKKLFKQYKENGIEVGSTNQQKNNHHMLFLLKMSNLPSILFKILLKLMGLSCQAAHRMLGSIIANFSLLNVLVILCMGSMQRLWMNVDKRRYL